jgi:oxygen-dependent protoporphyrinogen oxidase
MIAVVGAGISGLTAAWELTRRGADVVVFETAPHVGGKLRTATVGDVTVDVGAEAMLARRPEGVGLLADLGLTAIAPLTTSASVRAGGALHPLPPRTMMGIPTDPSVLAGVLSPHAIERVTHEPAAEPLPPLTDDITVGELVRARLGNEVTDRLVEPLLGGVYAGRADALSLRATVPHLAIALQAGGSLVEAARGLIARAPVSDAPVFASVPGGLGSVPVALAERLDVRTGTTIRAIRRDGTGFVLEGGAVPDAFTARADAVVLAVPAAKAARLLADCAPDAAAELGAIESASVAIVTFAFDLDAVELPAGSGLLVGAREGLAVKGVTLSSQKWPLPTGGRVLLRASLGRAGDAEVLQRPDAALAALARHELTNLLGITAEPVDALVTRWGGGMPQYALGHVERVARIRAAVDAVPGLAICGAAFDGVGIPACIASAQAAATRLGQ